MSKQERCHDCLVEFACKCGAQADGTYFYDYKHHSHYGLGAIRCDSCSTAFTKANQARDAELKRIAMKNHLESNHEDGEYCPECCEHEFDPGEGFCCLNCGTDGSEDVMATAYDMAKDFAKYGE